MPNKLENLRKTTSRHLHLLTLSNEYHFDKLRFEQRTYKCGMLASLVMSVVKATDQAIRATKSRYVTPMFGRVWVLYLLD